MRYEVDYQFKEIIIFCEEANFFLDKYVNEENCRIWGLENHRKILEWWMPPQRGGEDCRDIFFENQASNAVTVKGICCRKIWTSMNCVSNRAVPHVTQLDKQLLNLQENSRNVFMKISFIGLGQEDQFNCWTEKSACHRSNWSNDLRKHLWEFPQNTRILNSYLGGHWAGTIFHC